MTIVRYQTIQKLKTNKRFSHSLLDDEINDQIEACLADLKVCGIAEPDETDALILAALKLWFRANFTSDTDEAAKYIDRYNAQKACLMMAEGYGGGAND